MEGMSDYAASLRRDMYQEVLLEVWTPFGDHQESVQTVVTFLFLYTLLLLLLTGTIFSYFCISSITSVLILAILIAINDIHSY